MSSILKTKNNFKCLLCVVFAFCILSSVFVPFTKIFVSADTPYTKMLYIKSSAPEELMQTAAVTIGETYYFSFGISSKLTDFDIVCQTDDRRREIDVNPQLINKIEKGDSFVYTYSITIPEKTVNNKPVTDKVFVGLLFSGSIEGYIYEPSLYIADDINKTELFINRFNGGVLDNWTFGYTWFGEWDGIDVTEWSDDATTLKVVDYNDYLFGIGGAGSDKKMYYIKSSGPKELIHQAPVEPGETYYLTFGMSSSIRRFDAAFMSDETRSWIDDECPQIKKISKGGCNIYTYSCKVPEDYQQKYAFFGVKPYGNIEGYIFDIAVYKKDDSNKTNVLPNADFSDAFNGWSYGWDAWFGTWDPADTVEWSDEKALIKIVNYDEELLGLNAGGGSGEDSNKKMLHINSTAPKALIQRVEVEQGKTYHFTFGLSSSIRKFDVICQSDGTRSEVDANITEVNKVDNGNHAIYTYSYTIPASYSEKMIFFGVQPNGQTDGYFFGASVYEADDEGKTELLDNPDFSCDLSEWSWGWDAWFGYWTGSDSDATEWTSDDGSTTIKIINYDEGLFGTGGSVDSGKKMLYFVNGPTNSQLGLLSKVKAGETYCLEFNMFATGIVNLKVAENGLRASVSVQQNLETVENGNYTRYKYTFTMPDDASGEYFVGPDVTGFVEGFIFDLTLYQAYDETKKELYSNPVFEYDLDDWIWGWNAWFNVLDESGVKDWTDGSNILNVMAYDLSKIDELIALINVDDGEWWDEKDLISEEAVEIANLKGTLTNQNKLPFVNTKLVLASEGSTFNTTSNSKGEFEFKNFPVGFYELYILDSEGNQIATNYYGTFSNGDNVTLTLVCDTTELLAELENNTHNNGDWTNNSIEQETTNQPEKNVGALKGGVYTPELKTVADLKIYIRGIGDTVTDKKGEFSFENIPVGSYEMYTVLDDGSEYVFRTVSVKENVELSVKLKYDVGSETNVKPHAEDELNWVWIIIGSISVFVAAGIVIFIVFKKKKA